MIRFILTTFPDEASARSTVCTLLDEHLIACGTLLPGASSLYRWKGEIEESREVVVLLKTSAERAESCRERLAGCHPYEVPEIVNFSPSECSESYARWVLESVAGGRSVEMGDT